MVQNTKKKKGVPKAVPKKMEGARVKSVKEMQEEFSNINESPDGLDPEPLTVPKCVECSHCGWPVYPRECKVATKKTFARAGIDRGTKKEEEAQKKAERDAALAKGDLNIDDEEEDAESEDSRDTAERMADQLEDLQDKNDELEAKVEELTLQNEELTTELEATKKKLEEAEERIEFLEEAEVRWRDKLSQARLEIERLKLALERSSNVSADREAGLIASLLDAQELRRQIARAKRRRALMLDGMERKLATKEEEDYQAISFRMWRQAITQDRMRRKLEDLEQRRAREVGDLQKHVAVERARVEALRATEVRLKARLTQAAHRFLARSMSTSAFPAAPAHVLRAWCGVHPAVTLENELERTKAELEALKIEHAELQKSNAELQVAYDKVVEEHETLKAEHAEVKEELEFIKAEMGGSKEALEARLRAEREKEAAHQQAIEELEQKIKDLRAQKDQEIEELENEITTLEGRLTLAESAAAAGGPGGPVAEVDEATRVCPKGQGVLCVGCLKQLVHRSVKPLPPLGTYDVAPSLTRLEKEKKAFFEREMLGMGNPDDSAHSHVYKARKDPYGISRLTVLPTTAFGTKSAPTLPEPTPSPKTGLPALKKSRRLRHEGVADPLRSTMSGFKPGGFR